MDIRNWLGIIAAIVGFAAMIPYNLSILRGKTKPNRATWLIWSVVALSILASYHSSGATTTIWLTVVYTFLPVEAFLMSLKYGVGGYEKLDIICLIGAATGLLLWKLTNSPETALYLNIVVDAMGFLPTIKKAYLEPETEDRLAWNIAVVAALLNILALTSLRPQIALYPLYLLATNLAVAVSANGILQKHYKARRPA